MLLNLHEDLTQAAHASATSEMKLIQHPLHSAKPGNNRLLDPWSCLVERSPTEQALLPCSTITTAVFSLHVNMLGVTFVICHLYVFFGGGF